MIVADPGAPVAKFRVRSSLLMEGFTRSGLLETTEYVKNSSCWTVVMLLMVMQAGLF